MGHGTWDGMGWDGMGWDGPMGWQYGVWVQDGTLHLLLNGTGTVTGWEQCIHMDLGWGWDVAWDGDVVLGRDPCPATGL